MIDAATTIRLIHSLTHTLSLGATAGLAGFLYGVTPTDPITFLGVAALLIAVALGASAAPALRAARADPVLALRQS